jgi:hypothetical protein
VAKPKIFDLVINTLHGRRRTDNLMAQVVTKMRSELRAVESSTCFFRQSPAAQGAPSFSELVSYQKFDDSYRDLAPFTRGLVDHLCKVDDSQTVENPGKADYTDDDVEHDEKEDNAAEGALAGGVQLEVEFEVRAQVAHKARRRRNKAMMAAAVASVALFSRSARCKYFQVNHLGSYN